MPDLGTGMTGVVRTGPRRVDALVNTRNLAPPVCNASGMT